MVWRTWLGFFFNVASARAVWPAVPFLTQLLRASGLLAASWPTLLIQARALARSAIGSIIRDEAIVRYCAAAALSPFNPAEAASGASFACCARPIIKTAQGPRAVWLIVLQHPQASSRQSCPPPRVPIWCPYPRCRPLLFLWYSN